MTTLDRQQRVILFRTFFSRLFESDLMPAGLPQVRLVISTIAGITMPLTFMPVMMRLSGPFFVLFQYTVAMVALAFVALMVWEGIFPDRRDARILSALPIRLSTFVIARLGALAALFGIVSAGSTALPSLAFVTIGNPVAHLAGLMGIGAFAFFSIVAVQCVLLNVFGRAAAQQLAILLQIAVVIVVLQAPFVLLPHFVASSRTGAWTASGPAGWLPSIWFLGLFDLLSGKGTHGNTLALSGAAAALGTPLAAIALYAATYRRLLRRALEGEPVTAPRSAAGLVRTLAIRLLAGCIPSPVSRAVCFFTLRTMARSRQHKMLLAMYVGVALALVLAVVVDRAVRRGWGGFAAPDVALLAVPLVLLFLTLVGIRALIGIPLEIKGNWIFRLREPRDRGAAVGGVAMAMIAAGVLPIAALTLVLTSVMWGPASALPHVAFCAALGVLLAQALVVRLEKIPFTCTYLPGASRMRILWPLYVFAFFHYTVTVARYQAAALRRGETLVVETLAIVAVAALVVIARHVNLRQSQGFRFEEEDPEALFKGFKLSESLAAGAVERPAGGRS